MISPGAQLRASADPTASAVRGSDFSARMLCLCCMEMRWAVTAQPRCVR